MKEKIENRLIELSDIKYKEFKEKICSTNFEILGVRIPVLRTYAKKLLKSYDVDFLLENIGNKYYEEIMLQGIIIANSTKNDICKILNLIDKYVLKIDNWEVCDIFCAELKIIKKFKEEFWIYLKKYFNSNKEFEIRFFVVIILNYYIEEKYLDDIFDLFDRIKSDKYYAKMAIAWAISICLVKDYYKTIIYLKNCKIDKFIYNKSIQKAIESYRISNDRKNKLRKMKK